MIKIYALVCEGLILYVGRTTLSLKDRAKAHRCRSNYTTSKYIPEWMGWEIRLLEEVPDNQAITKEQHYYDTLKPLYNYQRPGNTAEELSKTQRFVERRKLQRNTDEGRAQRNEYQRAYRASKKALTQ